MDTGILIALGFAAFIIALAVFLGRVFSDKRKQRRFGRDGHDINSSHADGRASATWAGINAARGGDDGFAD